MKLYEIIGKKVKEAREAAKVSQRLLGDMLGLTRVSVAKFEKGTQRLPLEKLMLICYVFDIELSDLVKEYSFEELVSKETIEILKKETKDYKKIVANLVVLKIKK